jgi:hypothetical protein
MGCHLRKNETKDKEFTVRTIETRKYLRQFADGTFLFIVPLRGPLYRMPSRIAFR